MVNLGLSSDSMACYHLGNALRNRDDLPSLDSSPIDFVKSDDEKIRVILKGMWACQLEEAWELLTVTFTGSREHAVDLIAFESLIPKSILQRYVALISEHKRVILCGPSGTGKSFLARKIAQHLVLK
jgi:neuron navigator 2